MDWQTLRAQLVRAEHRVSHTQACMALARQAVANGRLCTVNAEDALNRMQLSLQHDIECRNRLKERLRLITH